jgi:hypothetical protein
LNANPTLTERIANMLRQYSDGTTPTGVGLPPIGALAYWDSYTAGLVPCKVENVGAPNDYGQRAVFVRLTASRGIYKRGELIGDSARGIVPRSAVYVRGGQYRIRSYVWSAG